MSTELLHVLRQKPAFTSMLYQLSLAWGQYELETIPQFPELETIEFSVIQALNSSNSSIEFY